MRHADQIYTEAISCMKNILEFNAVSFDSGIGYDDNNNVGDTGDQGRERGSDDTKPLHHKKAEKIPFSYFRSQANDEEKREWPENYIRKHCLKESIREEGKEKVEEEEEEEERKGKKEFRSLADIEFYQLTSQAGGNCGKKI